MELNKCELRKALTTCCISKKYSTEELSDIYYTIIQSSKLRVMHLSIGNFIQTATVSIRPRKKYVNM